MTAHATPPAADPSLDAIAADVARSADAAVAAADRADRDGGGDGLDAAATLLGVIDRLTAAVIGVLQASDHRRVITERGLTRDGWLRAVAGRTGVDAGMLLAAAERLVDMPAVTAWFSTGVLSWGAVRAIVAATRNLTAAQRGWVDQTLADHDIDRLDGDQVAAAVDGLAMRARADLHRDRDSDTLRRRWLRIQPRLDGTADIAGTLDPKPPPPHSPPSPPPPSTPTPTTTATATTRRCRTATGCAPRNGRPTSTSWSRSQTRAALPTAQGAANASPATTTPRPVTPTRQPTTAPTTTPARAGRWRPR
jgi:hypothetical protein